VPELPDTDVYITTLATHIRGERLDAIRIRNPFLLRSVVPALSDSDRLLHCQGSLTVALAETRLAEGT